MPEKWTVLALAALISVVSCAHRPSPAPSPTATPERSERGALLIDVRTADEFNAGHLTGAINIPLNELQQTVPARVPDKSRALLLYCRSGRRSAMAEQQLRALGYTNALNIGTYEQAEAFMSKGR